MCSNLVHYTLDHQGWKQDKIMIENEKWVQKCKNAEILKMEISLK